MVQDIERRSGTAARTPLTSPRAGTLRAFRASRRTSLRRGHGGSWRLATDYGSSPYSRHRRAAYGGRRRLKALSLCPAGVTTAQFDPRRGMGGWRLRWPRKPARGHDPGYTPDLRIYIHDPGGFGPGCWYRRVVAGRGRCVKAVLVLMTGFWLAAGGGSDGGGENGAGGQGGGFTWGSRWRSRGCWWRRRHEHRRRYGGHRQCYQRKCRNSRRWRGRRFRAWRRRRGRFVRWRGRRRCDRPLGRWRWWWWDRLRLWLSIGHYRYAGWWGTTVEHCQRRRWRLGHCRVWKPVKTEEDKVGISTTTPATYQFSCDRCPASVESPERWVKEWSSVSISTSTKSPTAIRPVATLCPTCSAALTAFLAKQSGELAGASEGGAS